MTSISDRIESKDISVIIQGPVDNKLIPLVTSKIKELLPQSEMILSTWEGAKASLQDGYDHIIFNKDPKGFKDPISGFQNNLNRLILSTQTGLSSASRKYSLKLRTDLVLESTDFLNFFNKYEKRNSNYVVFEEKIITSSFFCKKHIGRKYKMPVPYHIGDWVFFGLTSDMKILWDIPLSEEPSFSYHFFQSPYKGTKFDGFRASHKMAPEQYIFVEAIKKKHSLCFDTYLDYDSFHIENSHHFIINNFIIIDPQDWKFSSLKQPYKDWTKNLKNLPNEIFKGIYRREIFEKDYTSYFQMESYQ